jgi:hypothetical protein
MVRRKRLLRLPRPKVSRPVARVSEIQILDHNRTTLPLLGVV